jgi:hypothetical protein
MPKVRRISPDEIAEIRRLYALPGLGYRGVGEMVGRHWTTIRNLIPPVERKTSPARAALVDAAEARWLYLEQGWSLGRVAGRYGCKPKRLKDIFGPGFPYRDGSRPSPAFVQDKTAPTRGPAIRPRVQVSELPAGDVVAEEGSVGRALMELINERHLDDLDAGGYPDASATELLNPPDCWVPIHRQRLYSSLARPPVFAGQQDRACA